MRCDHGIALDRYCADCEDGFRYPDEPERHHWSRSATVAAYLAAAALALWVLVTRWPR